MKLLVTGASGKVGQAFLPAFLGDPRFVDWQVVALCNNRTIEPAERVCVVSGSMADADVVAGAMQGVTHVVHMAAVKETPALIFDVALKGLFLLLDDFRKSDLARQFIHLSGDCAVGHIFQRYDGPVTEASPRRSYQGCYALTKTLEEVMLEQFGFQYGVNWSTLRASWIMEKDDFRYALALGDSQFGGPAWAELIDLDAIRPGCEGAYVPVMRDINGDYLKRNFVHVDDVVSAILAAIDNPRAEGQLFNISMDQPVDYGAVGARLATEKGLKQVDVDTPFHSNWLDNSKARMMLGWAPRIDLEQMIDRAWQYKRADSDPRIVWYPG
ncbi:MAG: NAD-dependent epimerase/dehydratase family protein [Allorhizobium sp.]